jgi:GNAT superfamily N-acetyltransferase
MSKNSNTITIHEVHEESRAVDFVRHLFTEYFEELNENLEFQSYTEDLEDPLRHYGPPRGKLLLAYYYNEPAGCIALQWLEDGICEMKRLYVKPEFRERGIGDKLITEIVNCAKEMGYKKMLLDSLERLKAAHRLYMKYGFENTPAYYHNPLTNVIYMEKNLEDE